MLIIQRNSERVNKLNRIPIKPLSVNRAWKGKRFKTAEYNFYEQQLLLLLPRNFKVPAGNLEVEIEMGFSNSASDIDNPIKPFIDILQKAYEFNDKLIQQLKIKKRKVNKGEEYISFYIGKYV